VKLLARDKAIGWKGETKCGILSTQWRIVRLVELYSFFAKKNHPKPIQNESS